MREKILNLLGLMRRANALSLGEDKALDSLKAGKAKLLLFASDVSDNARRKAENLLAGRNAQPVPLPLLPLRIWALLTPGCSCSPPSGRRITRRLPGPFTSVLRRRPGERPRRDPSE